MWPFKQTERFDQPLPELYERIISGAQGVKDFADLSTTLTLQQSMQALIRGGFPEPALEVENNTAYFPQWMDNYISNYVNRDIRSVFHKLNMSNMARALEISVPTIKDYLDIIHQTFRREVPLRYCC